MRVSAKSEYAVRAMVYLARAHGRGPVPLSQVAEREHIPLDFLEQVMLQLRNHGLVKSVRGVHGGYLLATEPGHVTVGAIMEAVEGPPVPIHCVETSPEDPTLCSMGVTMLDCTTRDVWVLLYGRIAETLNAVTLADLARPTHRPLRAELPMAAATR